MTGLAATAPARRANTGTLKVVVVVVAVAAMLRAAHAQPAPESAGKDENALTVEKEEGGTHLRISTAAGPVHVFRPGGYDRRTAGIVVYVHGYYIHVDDAWRDHRLARQFADSRRNALFIAPEAPAVASEPLNWPRLQRLLVSTLRRARLERPRGPLVVVGHSGAYRTIVPWLSESALRHLVLVDALYGKERDFRRWLRANPANRMTLAVRGTAKWANPFVRSLPYAATARRIPDKLEQLTRAQRGARVLALRSQYGHFELITEGKALPLLLRRPPLTAVRSPRL